MTLRWLEFLFLFCTLPLMMVLYQQQAMPYLIPTLVIVAAYCLLSLFGDPSFNKKRLGRIKDYRKHKHLLVKPFLLGVLPLAAICLIWFPGLFLVLPTHQTQLWLATLLIYPLLSVVPQELIFRTFFFHRFKKIFPDKNQRLTISTLCFAFVHGLYGNWMAVGLAFIGGLLFGMTYLKTKSTLVVVIQHSAWGLLIFTLGLGGFVHSGQMI